MATNCARFIACQLPKIIAAQRVVALPGPAAEFLAWDAKNVFKAPARQVVTATPGATTLNSRNGQRAGASPAFQTIFMIGRRDDVAVGMR